jgi:hypothetical protein
MADASNNAYDDVPSSGASRDAKRDEPYQEGTTNVDRDSADALGEPIEDESSGRPTEAMVMETPDTNGSDTDREDPLVDGTSNVHMGEREDASTETSRDVPDASV